MESKNAPYFGMHLNVGNGGVVVAVVLVVGVVVGERVGVVLVGVVDVVGVVVVVNVLVAVVVGVVAEQSLNPPFCHASAIWFSVAATLSQFSSAYSMPLNAHLIFDSSVSGAGPRNSSTAAFNAFAVVEHAAASKRTANPSVSESQSIAPDSVGHAPSTLFRTSA